MEEYYSERWRRALLSYRQKTGGPLLERIDLHIVAEPVANDEWTESATSRESSATIRERVTKASGDDVIDNWHRIFIFGDMKKIKLFLAAGALSLLLSADTAVVAADPGTPAAAGDVVKDACHEAAASHKKVLIILRASWCHWCRKLDTLLSNPDCKEMFDQSYVIRHLTVMETAKNLENPGAQDLYLKYAGSMNQGVPFFLIMNEDGSVVADSRVKPEGAAPGSTGENMGYPSSRREVAYFMRLLHETTPLSADQLSVIAGKLAKP